MEDALQRLQPATDASKLKGASKFSKPDNCVAVCAQINEHYSVPERGWFSDMKWETLREHAEARLLGKGIPKLG